MLLRFIGLYARKQLCCCCYQIALVLESPKVLMLGHSVSRSTDQHQVSLWRITHFYDIILAFWNKVTFFMKVNIVARCLLGSRAHKSTYRRNWHTDVCFTSCNTKSNYYLSHFLKPWLTFARISSANILNAEMYWQYGLVISFCSLRVLHSSPYQTKYCLYVIGMIKTVLKQVANPPARKSWNTEW